MVITPHTKQRTAIQIFWADFLKHPVRRDVQEGVGKQEHLPGSALEAFVGTHSREQIVLRGIDVEVCLDSKNRRVG
jgi:hypothetical protein